MLKYTIDITTQCTYIVLMVAKTTYAYLAPFIDARQHDDDRTVPLINHLPEIFACVGEWSL